jgi:DNA-binding CsgD family transcriptional regulator/pimeloyl-ACP methyl ester carboxylesterase
MDAPPVQYAHTSDGYDIAYAVAGMGRPLLFSTPPFYTVQTIWRRFPEWMEGLSSRFRTVAFDRRGGGLSTRGLPDDFSSDAHLLDFQAVTSLFEGEPCLIFVFGGAPGHQAVRFALASPESVKGMIWDVANVDSTVTPSSVWVTLPNENWPVFLNSIVPPGVTDEERRQLIREFSDAMTLGDWNAHLRAQWGSSVADELPKLRLPLLVLHRQDFPMFPAAESRKVAASVPGAKFVLIKGGQLLGDHDEGLAAIDAFVASLPPPGERPAAAAHDELAGGLSERELEVLRLLALGNSNQQIADELVISLNTVRRHVSNIFDKTGVANRAQATAYAKDHGVA